MATDAPFVVDFYDGGMKSVDVASRTEALRVAKKHGRHDRPAVVWKLSPGKWKKRYRPHCVVVEGKILK